MHRHVCILRKLECFHSVHRSVGNVLCFYSLLFRKLRTKEPRCDFRKKVSSFRKDACEIFVTADRSDDSKLSLLEIGLHKTIPRTCNKQLSYRRSSWNVLNVRITT